MEIENLRCNQQKLKLMSFLTEISRVPSGKYTPLDID